VLFEHYRELKKERSINIISKCHLTIFLKSVYLGIEKQSKQLNNLNYLIYAFNNYILQRVPVFYSK
jgi:hypothetical protein